MKKNKRYLRRDFIKLALTTAGGVATIPAFSTFEPDDPGNAGKTGLGEKIYRQFAEYLTRNGSSDVQVAGYVEHFRGDGTWDDIFYESMRGGSWETLEHLERLRLIAIAFSDGSSGYYQQPEILEMVRKGVAHWLEKDYRNPNWWHMRIGIPNNLGQTVVLLHEQLPDEMVHQSVDTILSRSLIEMTGQNLIWQSGVVFMRGLLTNDRLMMSRSSEAIWDQLRVTTEEGIQEDWSFHQHGPQLQFGNYGRSFANSLIMWASILRGTAYAPSEEKLNILGEYLLNGPAWTLWKGAMDLNACGRQFTSETPGNPEQNFTDTMLQLRDMKKVQPGYSYRFDAHIQNSPPLTGHKAYWRSAFSVHRTGAWYASVRMSSTHVIGTETANYENMQGRLWGDGTLLTCVSGSEYKDIAPLWNWRRLPGITADQKIIEVYPTSFNTDYGRSAFAGGLSDGLSGVAAMVLMREAVHARKTWFFEKDTIVCLGSDIRGFSHGNVYTSIEQCHLVDATHSQLGRLDSGEYMLPAQSWVHNGNIGYVFEQDVTGNLSEVKGNWLDVYPKFSDRPVSGKVFSLWVNHGKSPENAGYAYRIYPNVSSGQMARRIENDHIKILANSESIAAIETEQGIKAAVFRAGHVQDSRGNRLGSNKPCLLSAGNGMLIVCDPSRYHRQIDITFNEKTYKVDLPQGESAGKPVAVST